MKLIDLFEEDDDDFDYDYIVDKIENECGDMLEAYRGTRKVLYRGTKLEPVIFTKRTIRQDRKPVEMDAKAHDLLNKAMSKMELPTRGNSLFVSASKEIARGWGSLHVVFIPDGWKGLVYDGIPTDEYSYEHLESKAYAFAHSEKPEEEQIGKMIDVIKSIEPKKFTSVDDLEEVLGNNTADILINGQNYYALSLDKKYAKQLGKISKLLGIKL